MTDINSVDNIIRQKEAKRNQLARFGLIMLGLLCSGLGILVPMTVLQVIGYIIVALFVWLASTFCLAMGFMGYQFEKWYHWSNWIMYAVTFVQPVLYIVLGVYLFT